MPVVRIGNVQRDGFLMEDVLHIGEVSERQKDRYSITPTTLVMVGSNGNRDRVGNVFLATPQVIGHLLASFLIGIEPVADVSKDYLAAVLRSGPIQSLLTDSTAGSTGLKNLSLTFLRNLLIVRPPLPEQRSIAHALHVIDEAIEKTGEAITATEGLQEALRSHFLTLGVPGLHTDWLDVPGLGTVPTDWEVVRLDQVADVVGGTTPSRRKDEYWGGDIPWVVPSEVTALSGRYLTRSRECITGEGLKAAGLRMIPSGSVLLTSRATIGATAINTLPVATNQGFQNLICKAGVNSLWLFYCVSTFRKLLKKRASGSTFLEIARADVRSFPIPLPPLSEQNRIAGILDRVDRAYEQMMSHREALRLLRDSVAQALLAGSVRMPPTEREQNG